MASFTDSRFAILEAWLARHVSSREIPGIVALVVRGDEGDPRGFGWTGGYGTSGWDPTSGVIGVLMTRRMMEGPVAPPVFDDFWRGAFAAAEA